MATVHDLVNDFPSLHHRNCYQPSLAFINERGGAGGGFRIMKTKTKRINYPLLRQIRDEILKRPKQFEMSTWFSKDPGAPMCVTTACIAGWAVTIDKSKPECISPLVGAKSISPKFGNGLDYLSGNVAHKMQRRGRQLLGLNSSQANGLFMVSGWPDRFRRSHVSTASQEGRAKIAADRIDFFIKTKGTDLE